MSSRPARSKAEQSEATRRKLEAVGLRLFAARGFDAVSAEELVARARVTRGALYHHYGGKVGLFEAVVENVMRDLHAELLAAAQAYADPIQAIERSLDVFLRESSDAATQRVLLIDGPAVLGWTRWRQLDAKYGLGLLKQGLATAAAAGMLPRGDVDMVAHVLLGAMTEAAMVIARSSNPAVARQEAHRAIVSMIHSWA